MANYFYDNEDKQKIKVTLLEGKAKSWAKSFLDKKDIGKDKPLSSSQLRKFHFEVKNLEERLKNSQKPNVEFVRIRPLVKMIKSKAAYSCRTPGKDRKIPETFKNFIDEMIDNVHDYNDFKAFALCFEAVVGYFYGEGGR